MLSSFSAFGVKSKLDTNGLGEDEEQETTFIKNINRCFNAHHKEIDDYKSQEKLEASLLLRLGGAFNEVLKEDDIQDFDD